ncbi:ribonuclease III, partial [Marasmius fiardii PR-910]
RPHLFAILISADDICSRRDFSVLKLEWELQSVVHGLSDSYREELFSFPTTAETVILYGPSGTQNETPLLSRIRSLDPTGKRAIRTLQISGYALVEVGPWAADWVWKQTEANNKHLASAFNEEQDLWDIVRDYPVEFPDVSMKPEKNNVSLKAVKLFQLLKACESHGEEFCGIVFVRRRIVALALTALVQSLDRNLGLLRPVAMVHGRSLAAAAELVEQVDRGTYNLVIATRSFEDLELPQATVIIHYNLFDSQISRALAHARLREKGQLIYMVETGNIKHRRILSRITGAAPYVGRWAAVLRHIPGSSIPPNTQDPIDSYSSDSEDEDSDERMIRDPLTNSTLTIRNSVVALYRFSSNFFQRRLKYTPLFDFEEVTEHENHGECPMFRCRVILPGYPMVNSWSPPCGSKAVGRREASFAACLDLFNAGVLDSCYFPSTGKHLHDISVKPDNLAPLGEVFPGNRAYTRKSPEFWKNCPHPCINRLFPLIAHIPESTSYPCHGPILILCPQPLPEFPEFRVFFKGIAAPVQLTKAEPLNVGHQQLENLTSYTIRIWRYVRNKPYSCSTDNVPYFFAPVSWDLIVFKPHEKRYGLADVSKAIPWDLVSIAARNYAAPLQFGTPDVVAADVANAIVVDRWTEFTRRYQVVQVRPDLNPLSRPPSCVPGRTEYESFLEFIKAHRRQFNGLKDESQALMEVVSFSGFLDRLNPTACDPHIDSTRPRFFIPELCAKCTIPASTMRSAFLLPCILQRMEEFLLVKEFNSRLFSHGLSDNLLHMALTAESAEIEYDYERLEILGDSFIKHLSSIYVFVTHPNLDEGQMHVARQDIISNKSLFEAALSVGLPVYIHARVFTLKNWPPSNFKLETPTSGVTNGSQSSGVAISTMTNRAISGVESGPTTPIPSEVHSEAGSNKKKKRPKNKLFTNDRDVHYLSDKTIADVVEAIIGSAYISGGPEGGLRTAKALALPLNEVEQWSDFRRIADTTLHPAHSTTAAWLPVVHQIETIIGHQFRRPHLLLQALTHVTKANREMSSYNKLEFIGDAILEFMVVRHVFDRNPQSTPGALTMLKGTMVSNSTLAAVAVRSGLYRYLRFESSPLLNGIQAYVSALQKKESEERLCAAKEGRSPSQYWCDIEPPKPLADIVESIIGALYISDDFSPVGADKFFNTVLRPFYKEHITLQTLYHHPTKVLIELIQGKGCHQFKISREGIECLVNCHFSNYSTVLVHDVVLASAQDVNAATAAKLASTFALNAIEGDPDFLLRTCNCWSAAKAKLAVDDVSDILAGFEEGEVVI